MKRLVILLSVTLFVGCGNESVSGSSIESCVEAISSFDPASDKCKSLSHEDQKKAAELATKKSGVIVFLPPYEAEKAAKESPSEGEPEVQPTTFKEVRELAMKGNYQAQRNLAYGYSSLPYAGQDENQMLGCAWRIVIIRSGSEKVDDTDISNHRVNCDRLGTTERTAAEAQAEVLLKKIAANSKN